MFNEKELKVSSFDIAESLQTEEEIAAYIDAILEENDIELFIAALGDIARARGMSQIAKETGINRESLYKSLSGKVKPQFSTIHKVLSSFNLQLSVKAVHE